MLLSDRSDMRILAPGTRVRVPKGTKLVYNTGPDSHSGELGRAQTVTVAWMTHGGQKDTIYWAGSGGYWKGVDLTDAMHVLEDPR